MRVHASVIVLSTGDSHSRARLNSISCTPSFSAHFKLVPLQSKIDALGAEAFQAFQGQICRQGRHVRKRKMR